MDNLAVIRAAVAELRQNPPPGMSDCVGSGSGITIVEQENAQTYRVVLPYRALDGQVLPTPTGIRGAVVEEYGRQRLRLEAAEAAAAAARTDPATPATRTAPVVRAVSCTGSAIALTVALPWTEEERRALRDLERQQAAQLERERLARGPAEVVVTVPLGEDGRPDLDALEAQPLPADIRAAVLASLAAQEPE